jgi:hypothetical protein
MAIEAGACEAFKAKYGHARFKDLLHRIAWLLVEIVRDGTTAGVVGQTERDSFLVSIHPDEVAGVKSSANARIGDVLRSSYDPPDAERGFVLWPAVPGGPEDKVPLMALVWSEVEPQPE